VKLAKSLIITGLLFSSVLGSVNVGSITAMAAGESGTTVEAPVSDNNIVVKYTDQNGKIIADAEFIKKVKPTVTSTDISKPYELAKLGTLPANYELDNPKGTATIEDEAENKHSITVKVNRTKVKATYLSKEGRPVTESQLPSLISVINKKNRISKDNLDFPSKVFEKYDFDKYGSGVVTLKEKAVTAPTRPAKKPSKTGRVTQQVQVSFFDQNGDEVGYQLLKGKERDTTKIEAPKGYSFIKASDATIKFDKSGAKKLKLNVKRNTSTPVMEKGVITTNGGSFKRLYTIDGKVVTNRGLSTGSKWFTDQYATINGEKMLRVATNEWVKASDIH